MKYHSTSDGTNLSSSSFSSTPWNKVQDVRSSILKFEELLEFLEPFLGLRNSYKKMKNHTAIFFQFFWYQIFD